MLPLLPLKNNMDAAPGDARPVVPQGLIKPLHDIIDFPAIDDKMIGSRHV